MSRNGRRSEPTLHRRGPTQTDRKCRRRVTRLGFVHEPFTTDFGTDLPTRHNWEIPVPEISIPLDRNLGDLDKGLPARSTLVKRRPSNENTLRSGETSNRLRPGVQTHPVTGWRIRMVFSWLLGLRGRGKRGVGSSKSEWSMVCTP